MRNPIALVVGFLLIAAALILALGTTNQDNASAAQSARALATEFHTTPSATPTDTPTITPSLTPTLTPLPRHVTSLEPATDEVLDLLFHYPIAGMKVGLASARAQMIPLALPDGTRGLVVTGDHLEGGRGLQIGSGTFAAVLVWDEWQYVPHFLRIVWAHGYVLVSTESRENGEFAFEFTPLVQPASGQPWRRVSMVRPCSAQPVTPTTTPTGQPGDVERKCY